MSEYYQGSTITLSKNFTDSSGSPINSGVSGTTLNVYHYTNGAKVYNVITGTMLQDASNLSTFYYEYLIPLSSPLTNNIVQYDAIFSGTSLQSIESFGILQAAIPTPTGIGSVTVSGNVVNTSGSGIGNIAVSAAFLTGNTSPVVTTVTSSGIYTLQLDPNNYYITFAGVGFTTNYTTKTVPTGVTTFDFGNTTMMSPIIGSLIISDTYATVGPDGTSQIPLSGMQVSLFDKSATLAKAIAIAYTDVSGTFFLSANPGNYALQVQGTQPDSRVYQTAYDISVNSAFAGNFRYLGTSQYQFLI